MTNAERGRVIKAKLYRLMHDQPRIEQAVDQLTKAMKERDSEQIEGVITMLLALDLMDFRIMQGGLSTEPDKHPRHFRNAATLTAIMQMAIEEVETEEKQKQQNQKEER